MENSKIEYWDKEGQEELHYTNKDEAIESMLDNLDPLPETIEICGYARVEKPDPENLYGYVVEDLIEHLDCNCGLGHPNRDLYKITDGMMDAEAVFIKSVLSEYSPRACEIVMRETIDVKKWVCEHLPDCLKNLRNEMPENEISEAAIDAASHIDIDYDEYDLSYVVAEIQKAINKATAEKDAEIKRLRSALRNFNECASYETHEKTCFEKCQIARQALAGGNCEE